MTKKRVVLVCVFLSLLVTLFSQGALIERYLDAANENLTKREYKKAFDYINYVLSQYPQDKVPQNVEILAENVYYSYLVEIRDTRDMEGFSSVKDKLLEYEFLSTERVARLVKVINTLESQDVAWGAIPQTTTTIMPKSGTSAAAVAAQASQNEAEYKKQINNLNKELDVLKKVLEMAREDKQKDKELELLAQQKSLEMQRDAFEAALKDSTKTTKTNTTMLFFILAATVTLVIIIFIIVLVVGAANLRNSRKQREQFEATMEMVARISGMDGRGGIIGIGDGSDENLRSAGRSKLSYVALAQSEMSQKEEEVLKDLAIKCERLGAEVDNVTGRKNNSKNVSEMVFKISQQMQFGSFLSSLYFCVAMVYDAGFLLIDRNLFSITGKLSDEQKAEIRDHVKKSVEQLGFVPKEYRQVFEDAVLMHHENMDGSGYPYGITGDKIPDIARILRVAESFVALISRRNYRGISDKESALEELKSRPNIYDAKVVEALDAVL